MGTPSVWHIRAAQHLAKHAIEDPSSGERVLRMKQARYVLGQHLHIEKSLQPMLLRELVDAGLITRVHKKLLYVRVGVLAQESPSKR
jgi:ribosomal protein S25